MLSTTKLSSLTCNSLLDHLLTLSLVGSRHFTDTASIIAESSLQRRTTQQGQASVIFPPFLFIIFAEGRAGAVACPPIDRSCTCEH